MTLDPIAALTHEAEGATAAGNHLLAGALWSRANTLRRDAAARLAVQADADGDHRGAQALHAIATILDGNNAGEDEKEN